MPTNDPYTPFATVEPSGPPSNDFLRAQPSPASFGGEIAQGGAKLGADLFGAAIAKQDLTNEIHASEVNTWQADRTTDLFSTFSKLQGRAAQDALPQFKKDINDTFNQAQAQAGNIATQAQIARSGRMLTDAYYRYATNHADQQFNTWQTKTSTDRAGTYANMAGLAASQGDYGHMDAYLGVSDDEISKIYEAQGYDKDSIAHQVTKNRGANLKFIIDSRAAAGGEGGTPDPQGAAALYAQYKEQMDPASRLSVEGKLKSALLDSNAKFIGDVKLGRAPDQGHFDNAEKEIGLPRGYVSRSLGLGIAANGTPAPKPLVFGDSLGVGVKTAGGFDGDAFEGRSGAQVLAAIRHANLGPINGRQIILSSGASNDPASAGLAADQIKALEAQGAKASDITLLGVGDRADFAGVNDKLKAIADAAGSKFQPIDPAILSPDHVHPGSYGSLVPKLGASAAAPETPGGYVAGTFTLEGGNNPNAVSPGGGYRGLAQFSPALERRYGIDDSNRTDPVVQARALLTEAEENRGPMTAALGRAPRNYEYYLAHQQGQGGAIAQLTHPDEPAWRNMASTAEGKEKGPDWSKQAIWGNLTPQMKAQFPGGVETVTGSDFTRMWAARWNGTSGAIMPDKGVVYEGVLQATAGNPELQKRTLAYVNEQIALYNTVNATERATLSQTVPNLIQATEMGAEGVTLPSERIDAVMEPAKAQQWKDEFAIASEVGAAMRAARWASPAEIADMKRDLESGQGVLSEAMKSHGRGPTSGPGVAGAESEATENEAMQFRIRAGAGRQFETMLDRREAMLSGKDSDPAQYVMDNPAVKAARAGLAKADPAAYQAFGIATKAVQAQLGTPPDKLSVLTNDQSERLAARWANPDTAGGAQAVINEIKETARLWGDQWPDVYRQIAPKAGALIRVVGAGVQGTAARDLLEAQGVKDEEFYKGDPDGKIRADLATAVVKELRPFAATLSGSTRAQTFADFVSMGTRLAALRLAKSNDDATTAAQSAITDLLNFKYDYSGSVRVPNRNADNPAGVPVETVTAGIVEATKRLGERGPITPAAPGAGVNDAPGPLSLAPRKDKYQRGLSDEYLARETAQGLRDNGVWVTEPKEKGVALIDGDGFAARRADGMPVTLSWQQLASLAAGAKRRGDVGQNSDVWGP